VIVLSIEARQNRICFLLIPILGVLLVFRIFPILLSFIMSFYNWSVYQSVFIGLDNYGYFINDWIAKKSLVNTFYYTFLYMPSNIILALILAMMINQTAVLRSFYRMAFFMPLVMSMVAASILWKLIYQPQFGLLSNVTQMIGLGSPLWLLSKALAMPSVVVMNLWKSVGFNLVLFMAGLTNIPSTFYEAAIVDGASSWQKFWKITLPLLKPTLLFVMVMTVIASMQIFTQVYIMTEGGPEDSTRVFVQYLRSTSFLNLELGYGSALSFILFVIILAITIGQLQLMKTRWEY